MNHTTTTKTKISDRMSLSRYASVSVYLTTVLAVVGAVLQSAVLITVYEGDKGVYVAGDLFGHAVGIFLLVSAVLVFVTNLFLPRMAEQKLLSIPPCCNVTAFLSAMCGCSAVAASGLALTEKGATEGAMGVVVKLMLLLSVPVIFYFILMALNHKHVTLLTVLSFTPVLWLALMLMRLYFDRTSSINDPMKILFQLSLSAVMLAYMAEARIRVGKKGVRFLFAISSLAVVLAITSSISMFIFRLTGGVLSASSSMVAVTELLFALYLLSRLYAYRHFIGRNSEVTERETTLEEKITAEIDGDGTAEL